jgi:OmcA/MtrC family decaheme c-type cytochrome
MRMPSSVSGAIRIAFVLLVVIGAISLINAAREQAGPTVHDKLYYADANLVNFVRPGLVTKLLSAEIATDGTIKTRVKITDPKGLPLDREGIVTPGAVSLSFVAATIKKGETQYTAYTVRTVSSTITGKSATQATSDSNGRYEKVADGEYVYTFGTKATGADRTATHSVGVYSSRNLTEFDMGTQYDDDVLTFVPDGSKVTVTRDVVRTPTCNKCHDDLAFHGGTRRTMEMCILCHTPQTSDPDTGNTVDMVVMTHKIHMGEELPSVQAGGKYQIIGRNNAVADYSTVVFPANTRRCEFCHEQNSGAAQAAAYLKPNRDACGACHDNVNFQTGENHANLPQPTDNLCGTCHIPQGELEFDLSVKGAHVIETESAQRPGIVLTLVKVDDGLKGKSPKVTFTVRDYAGQPITMQQLTGGLNRLALVLAGPTVDYGYTNFGATTAGYISEDPRATAQCSADGTCTYTFRATIPANATGTYTIGIEGRREITLNPGTTKQVVSEYGAINKVINFAVDGSTVAARRTIVSIAKCNNCHGFLSLHGENRNQIEQCILCHNPSETDKARRPTATDPAERTKPAESVNMALMIHKIHTGEAMKEDNRGYTVIGFGGTAHDFSEVRYPAFSPSGSPADRRNCQMCHVDNSEQLPLQWGLNQVTDPQGLINPVYPITSACTSCHGSTAAASHALNNTDSKLGESCEVCHGPDAEFSINKAHAQ